MIAKVFLIFQLTMHELFHWIILKFKITPALRKYDGVGQAKTLCCVHEILSRAHDLLSCTHDILSRAHNIISI